MGSPGMGDVQWILTRQEWQDLPEYKNTTLEEELKFRLEAAIFIQTLGSKLKLPQPVISTAQTYMHRFYIRGSCLDFPPILVGQACIFIAGKVEEHPRKLGAIISLSEENEKEFTKDQIFSTEKIILQTLCFDLVLTHPYRKLFKIVQEVFNQEAEELVQSAWIIIKDTFKMPFCILYDSKTIAASALKYLSSRDKIDLKPMVKDENKYKEIFKEKEDQKDNNILEDDEIMNFYRQLYS